MQCYKYFFVILAVTCFANAVRINMKGSMSLGRHVLETLSHYLKKTPLSARRSAPTELPANEESEKVKWTIQSANVCKGLKICEKPFGEFIRNYVTLLANAIESIFNGILTQVDKDKTDKVILFIEQLKVILQHVNALLAASNDRIEDDNDKFQWIYVLKMISAKFQHSAQEFVKERLDGEPHDLQNVKKKLIQKLIIAIALVENRYENKLCSEHKICVKDHECTKALMTLLGEFNIATNDKAIEFIKTFYENLPDEVFYFVNPETAHDLQVILSELSHMPNAPAKDVLISVHRTVDARLKFLKTKRELSKAYDQQLVQIILSDLDYFYVKKHKKYPFDTFMGPFAHWLSLGGNLKQAMKQILKDLGKQLWQQPKELREKLENEVRVFLELTVDQEQPY